MHSTVTAIFQDLSRLLRIGTTLRITCRAVPARFSIFYVMIAAFSTFTSTTVIGMPIACVATVQIPNGKDGYAALRQDEVGRAHGTCQFVQGKDKETRVVFFGNGIQCNDRTVFGLTVSSEKHISINEARSILAECSGGSSISSHDRLFSGDQTYLWRPNIPLFVSKDDFEKLVINVRRAIITSGLPIRQFSQYDSNICFQVVSGTGKTPKALFSAYGVSVPFWVSETQEKSVTCRSILPLSPVISGPDPDK